MPSVVSSAALGTHGGNFGTAAGRGCLSLGGGAFGGLAKVNALVMPPTTPSCRAVESGPHCCEKRPRPTEPKNLSNPTFLTDPSCAQFLSLGSRAATSPEFEVSDRP